MESNHPTHNQTTELLVCLWDDCVVSSIVPSMLFPMAHLLQSVITPWLTVRKVKVEVEIVSFFFTFSSQTSNLTYKEQPSPKVAVIRFERGMQQGLLARIGRSSIMEYHAFGIIS